MYIILEIQTTGTTTALTPAVTEVNQNSAESTFHTKCASAAISSVGIHTVLMMDEYGNVIRHEYYEHNAE